MNRLIKTAMCIFFAAAMIPAAACSENTDSDPYALVTETEAPGAQLARDKAPVLGTWTATSTDPETGLDAATTLFTFHEDGSVTSVDPDTGANALSIFTSVTWNYDIQNENIIIEYVDLRGSAMEYTFDMTVANENYIILRVTAPDIAAGQKLSLTR